MVKPFRQKKLLSSNRLWPYALRFERNARRLQALGFNSVTVDKVAKCRDLNAYLVVYPLLAGRADEQRRAVARLPAYLCALHHAGVYYTALHFGQVLVQGESFALLDIASTQFRRGPISVNKRLGNFFNILRYGEDHAALTGYGFTRFFGDYLQCCQLGERRRAKLLRKLRNSPVVPELAQALGDLQASKISAADAAGHPLDSRESRNLVNLPR